MSNVNNVSWAKPKFGGAIYVGETTATLPNDAKSELDTSLVSLGYISEDGLSNSNSPESDKIPAWGGDTVLVISKGKPDTFTFKLIETTNVDVLKTVYGKNNVEGDLKTGIKLKVNADPAEARSYVVEMILKNDILKRIVIPKAVITDVGDIEYTDDDAVGYEITIEALTDKDGNKHYEYIFGGEK